MITAKEALELTNDKLGTTEGELAPVEEAIVKAAKNGKALCMYKTGSLQNAWTLESLLRNKYGFINTDNFDNDYITIRW